MLSIFYFSKVFLELIIIVFINKLVVSYSINDLNICGKNIHRVGKIIGGVESSAGDWGWQVIKFDYLF